MTYNDIIKQFNIPFFLDKANFQMRPENPQNEEDWLKLFYWAYDKNNAKALQALLDNCHDESAKKFFLSYAHQNIFEYHLDFKFNPDQNEYEHYSYSYNKSSHTVIDLILFYCPIEKNKLNAINLANRLLCASNDKLLKYFLKHKNINLFKDAIFICYIEALKNNNMSIVHTISPHLQTPPKERSFIFSDNKTLATYSMIDAITFSPTLEKYNILLNLFGDYVSPNDYVQMFDSSIKHNSIECFSLINEKIKTIHPDIYKSLKDFFSQNVNSLILNKLNENYFIPAPKLQELYPDREDKIDDLSDHYYSNLSSFEGKPEFINHMQHMGFEVNLLCVYSYKKSIKNNNIENLKNLCEDKTSFSIISNYFYEHQSYLDSLIYQSIVADNFDIFNIVLFQKEVIDHEKITFYLTSYLPDDSKILQYWIKEQLSLEDIVKLYHNNDIKEDKFKQWQYFKYSSNINQIKAEPEKNKMKL